MINNYEELSKKSYRTQASANFHTKLLRLFHYPKNSLNFMENFIDKKNQLKSAIRNLKFKDLKQKNIHNCSHFLDIVHLGLKTNNHNILNDILIDFISHSETFDIHPKEILKLLTEKNDFGYNPLHSILEYGTAANLDLYLEIIKNYFNFDENSPTIKEEPYIKFIQESVKLNDYIQPITLLALNFDRHILSNYIKHLSVLDQNSLRDLLIYTPQNQINPLHKALHKGNLNFVSVYLDTLRKCTTSEEFKNYLQIITDIQYFNNNIVGHDTIFKSAVKSQSFETVKFIHEIIKTEFEHNPIQYKILICFNDQSLLAINKKKNIKNLINEFIIDIWNEAKNSAINKVTLTTSIG